MNERGSITLWMVGLVMVVFAVGGIALDLWRGLSAHRFVASTVDAAAVAAGSAIDESRWRLDGSLALDPVRVQESVAVAVGAQTSGLALDYSVVTSPDGSEATIEAGTIVNLTLLAVLVDGDLEVSARATAEPTLSP